MVKAVSERQEHPSSTASHGVGSCPQTQKAGGRGEMSGILHQIQTTTLTLLRGLTHRLLQGHLLHLTLSPSTVTTPASQTLPSFRKDVDTWLTVLAIKSHLSENQLRHPRTATLHASPGVSSTSQLTSPANCFQNTFSHLHKLCHSPATPGP